MFPPAKKGKLSASCSTMQSARVLAESFIPDSPLSPVVKQRTYTASAEEEMKGIWWNVTDVVAPSSGFTLSVWGSLKLPKVNGTAMTVHKSSISMIRVLNS